MSSAPFESPLIACRRKADLQRQRLKPEQCMTSRESRIKEPDLVAVSNEGGRDNPNKSQHGANGCDRDIVMIKRMKGVDLDFLKLIPFALTGELHSKSDINVKTDIKTNTLT
jgi:hypothetical protein